MTELFSPLTLRGITLRNRIGVSPMCQYSSEDGFATDWHLAHIGGFAKGGAGLVIMEMTAVVAEGRISPGCLGLWKDGHVEMLSRIVTFGKSQGAVMGIQIAHAGRKASMDLPWKGSKRLLPGNGGWITSAPSAIPFSPDQDAPHEMTLDEIEDIKKKFVATALRAKAAGFQLIELHGAHGYLLNQFLSPLTNKRTDAYGQDRRKLIREIAADMRKAVGNDIILGARLSCVDWKDGGVQIEDSIETAKQLKAAGLDFVDCTTGGLVPDAVVPAGPGFQVPFAKAVRAGAGIPTMAVGFITTPAQADDIIKKGEADVVLLGREMLRDPHFALHAAKALGAGVPSPVQYLRGF